MVCSAAGSNTVTSSGSQRGSAPSQSLRTHHDFPLSSSAANNNIPNITNNNEVQTAMQRIQEMQQQLNAALGAVMPLINSSSQSANSNNNVNNNIISSSQSTNGNNNVNNNISNNDVPNSRSSDSATMLVTQPNNNNINNTPLGQQPVGTHILSPVARDRSPAADFSLLSSALSSGSIPQPSAGSSIMPAIPKSAIDKIRSGEFVNFDTLLPCHGPVAHDEYTFQVVGGSSPSVSLVPRNQNKPRVINFNLWMVSWTNFFRTYVVFWPQRMSELLRYQATICDFANQFTFAAWSGYDRMFRYSMASDPSLSWSRVDDDLYNHYLRDASLQVLCYNCHTFGHLASSCPLRVGTGSSEGSQPFRAPQRSTDINTRRASAASQNTASGRPQRYCHFFNNHECNNRACSFCPHLSGLSR